MRRSVLGMLCTTVLAIAALAVMPQAARAQNAEIRGTVRSDNGEAVVGANVYIVELGANGATNEAGRFVITIPGDRVRGQQLQLRVRAIGYRPSSRAVTITVGSQTADFTLAADVNRLDEIVVTGVMEGTEKTRLPFTVSTVDAADVPVPPTDPLRMLTGRVPGAQVVSASGRPGDAPAVILRGPTSINASGRDPGPLYIVDGIIITGGLPDINPSDIENIEVVKGAAAASLYGARAGNGVIQITTRTGRRAADGMSFNVRAETGGSDVERDFGPAKTTAMMFDQTGTRFCAGGNAFCSTTIDWNTEALRINNVAGDFAPNPVSFPLDPGNGVSTLALRNSYQAQLYPGRSYNVVKAAIQPQQFVNTTVDMTGRFSNTTVYASASGLSQGGAIRFLQGFQRYSGRLNVDQRIGSQWTASIRTYYGRNMQDGINSDGVNGGSGTAFFRLTRQRAIENLLATDTLGRLFIRSDLQGAGSQNQNPLYLLQNDPDRAVIDRFLGGMTLRFAPARWVDFEGNFSYDLENYEENEFQDKGFRTTSPSATANNGFVYQNAQRTQGLNTSFNATFRENLTRDIQARLSLRALYEQQDLDFRRGQGNLLAVAGVPTLPNASQSTFSLNSFYNTTRQIGLFAGVGLDMYNGRYGVDGLLRRDGSSLFGANNRWATFGRVSGYWNAALESWWPAPNTFSSFKLRASHGTAGGRPNYSAQYEAWNVVSGAVQFSGTLGNVNLKPEITTDNEIGADIELFRRALVTITYDNSKTKDQILLVPISADKGFTQQWSNAGVLSNRSLELSLNLPVVQRRNVSWTWTFTYDRTRTRIDSLSVAPFQYGSTSQATSTIYQAYGGAPYAEFWGRKFVKSCADLPATWAADCGGANSMFQINDDGFVVWAGGTTVGSGSNFTWRDGIRRNLYEDSLPAGLAPWGVSLNFGMPIVVRDPNCVNTPSPSCSAAFIPLGNSDTSGFGTGTPHQNDVTGLPQWQFSIGQNFQYGRLSVYALLQGVMGRWVHNQGFAWAHLDFMSGDIDQAGRSVETAKPIGYYFRAKPPDNSGGIGGLYDILGPNNYNTVSSSYAKLRELSVSYNVGPVSGVGNWTVSLIGRNLFTITNYPGFDPEVGQGGGNGNSAAINAVDAFTFPNTRTLTFALSTSF